MHLDMFSVVNLYGVGGAIRLGLDRFLAGGCWLLVCRSSYGIRMVVSRFLMGPCDSFIDTSAMLCVFLFSDRWISMIVPCVILLLCVCCDIECLGLICIVSDVVVVFSVVAVCVGGMGGAVEGCGVILVLAF